MATPPSYACAVRQIGVGLSKNQFGSDDIGSWLNMVRLLESNMYWTGKGHRVREARADPLGLFVVGLW